MVLRMLWDVGVRVAWVALGMLTWVMFSLATGIDSTFSLGVSILATALLCHRWRARRQKARLADRKAASRPRVGEVLVDQIRWRSDQVLPKGTWELRPGGGESGGEAGNLGEDPEVRRHRRQDAPLRAAPKARARRRRTGTGPRTEGQALA
ncbi:hypothetical protein ACWGB8_10780 [Kitasatospora sp. NPDC054939]